MSLTQLFFAYTAVVFLIGMIAGILASNYMVRKGSRV